MVLSTMWIRMQLSFELAAKLGFKAAAKAAGAVIDGTNNEIEALYS